MCWGWRLTLLRQNADQRDTILLLPYLKSTGLPPPDAPGAASSTSARPSAKPSQCPAWDSRGEPLRQSRIQHKVKGRGKFHLVDVYRERSARRASLPEAGKRKSLGGVSRLPVSRGPLIVLLLVSNQRWTLSAPNCALLQKSAIYSRHFESDSASTVWAERAAVFHNPEPFRAFQLRSGIIWQFEHFKESSLRRLRLHDKY